LGGVANSGIAHIVMNTLSLWQLGRVLEPLSGRVRFLALYLISALGGSVLEYILVPDRPSVGASGALYGLTAAYFLMSRRSDADSLWARQTVVWSLIWLVLSAGFTSWQGHLGGFVTGSLVAAGFAYTPRHARVTQILAAAAVVASLAALVVWKTSQLVGDVG
jgi:membrane associated rhomboid family serine protease